MSDWPGIETIKICIHIKSSGNCFIGDEGCRLMTKQSKQLEFLQGKIDVSQVMETVSKRLASAS